MPPHFRFRVVDAALDRKGRIVGSDAVEIAPPRGVGDRGIDGETYDQGRQEDYDAEGEFHGVECSMECQPRRCFAACPRACLCWAVRLASLAHCHSIRRSGGRSTGGATTTVQQP